MIFADIFMYSDGLKSVIPCVLTFMISAERSDVIMVNLSS